MGYRSRTDYQQFYDLGANKYIMKFETSNKQNYRTMKNGESINTRLEHLNTLRKVGYDIGSGNIYGLPGQSEEDLYKDLVLMKKLECNLASVSPFIVPSQSVLEGVYNAEINNVLNYLAIMRLELESALIPSVSAFELLKENGQLDAFNAGANVITINMTPAVFRESYPIYNSKRNIVKFDYAKNVIENAGLSLAVEL
ncbi:[FeFe]-hydrogenase maturation protein HydE [Fusibacter sp. 3D3]|nr:hypothetical protein [Fusibacter sp. 3D3]GAU75465.1 [FeFe]-hydrogenase maturation protein HydE [Fusibacter sp. 3D3]